MRLKYLARFAKLSAGLLGGAAGGACAAVMWTMHDSDENANRRRVAYNPAVSENLAKATLSSKSILFFFYRCLLLIDFGEHAS
jgi:hypothetical protein